MSRVTDSIFLGHTIKIRESVAEKSVIRGREPVWSHIEKYREGKKDLYIMFIDVEKTYDKVSREVL
ncbi:hypothetical protein H5410_044383 [Solanum commersonii]|uniref:Reverse transcriptase domain-containing protein n=1 Tax=Solanum commersonii TaxID=4109 RepID=A0A9J5X8W8_SOLCO|nr:hypothetical protein H5410_044383 [Solanum commersonii]